MISSISSLVFQSAFYKYLSDCYLLPDIGLRQTLVGMKKLVSKAYPQHRIDVGKMLEDFDKPQTIEQFQVEYTRLFIGPYKMLAPPYESVYHNGDGTLMGNSTLEVMSLFREAGYSLADDYHDAPDHIATELEFMHILVAGISEFVQKNDTVAAEQYMRILISFLTDHLANWIPGLTRQVETVTGSEFYRSLARITRRTIEDDVKRLQREDLVQRPLSSDRQ